jgi:uncharacterized membrane protein (UPF0182 family)
MPELRLVVLALQDRLAYGTTFEAAMAGLFGQALPPAAVSSSTAASAPAGRGPNGAAPAGTAAAAAAGLPALIRDAAHDLAEYQRLTAEGKLGEAGQRLESLKQKLEDLQKQQRR